MKAHVTIEHDDDPGAVAEKFGIALAAFGLCVVDVTSQDDDVTVTYEIREDPALKRAAFDRAFAEGERRAEERRDRTRAYAKHHGLNVDAPPAAGQVWTSYRFGADGGDWIFTVEDVRDGEVEGYWNRSDDVCTCPSDTLTTWPPVDPSGNAMILEAP